MKLSGRALFARVPTVIRGGFFPGSSPRRGLTAAAVLGIFLSTWWVAAQSPAGFLEKAERAVVRASWSASQMRSFLPARGRFTFPAPYNTEGIRLTNATDCDGRDCVRPISRADGRNINNHRDRDTMLVFLGLRAGGPTLFSYSKSTGQVRNLGPLFGASSPLSRHSGEGWYFSATRPTELYVVGERSPKLLRYDVLRRTFDTVFDATTQFGHDRYITQAHSSDDDNVHSATLEDASSREKLGCLVYREDAGRFSFYPALDDFAECQIDKSGRWLVIKEEVDGHPGRDYLTVDMESGAESAVPSADGVGGASDNGNGYMVAADDGKDPVGGVRLWGFDQGPVPGPVVYLAPGGVGPITHSNAQPGVPLSRQFACTAGGAVPLAPRANEVVCFRLDGSLDVLVVTQNMSSVSVRRPAARRAEPPTGNLDVTGRYFVWVTDVGGSRADAFMVKVPAQRLTGEDADQGPSPDSNPDATARPEARDRATSPKAQPVRVPGPLAATPDPSTVAYLEMNEGSGTITADSSGHGNAGTLMNGAGWTAGVSGQAVSLDGVANYVRISHSPALNAFPITASVWFKTTTTSGVRGLVSKYVAGSFNGYQIYFVNGNLCAWYMKDSANYVYDGTSCTLSTAGYNDGNWHQAAFVVDATGGSLYVDGGLQATRAWTGTAGPTSTTQDISLGYYGGYLAATVDELQICSRVFSASEVQQSFDNSRPAARTAPIVYLKLDEGTGITAADSSGNGNTGTLVNGAAWAAGVSGQAVSLDGVAGYVRIPHSPSLDPYPLTAALWFKTTTSSGVRGLVNKYLAGSFNGYQIYFVNGSLCAWYMKDSANYVYDGTNCTLGAPGYNDGSWHHVALVVDASGGRLYVDGTQKATRAWTGTAGPTSSGQDISLGYYGGYLAATIDEVQIYSRALSAAEIGQLAGGPIAYLKMDEGTGVTAADSSGNGNTGTLMNGAAWTAGVSGQAVSLDGVDDYVRIPHSPSLNAYPLTASVWFKTTTASGVTGLVNKYLAGSFNGYQIYFVNGNLCAWYMKNNANYVYDGTGCTLSTPGFNDGSWHQAALVVDDSGGRLYVDGAQKATRAWTGTAGPPTTTQNISVGYYGSYLGGTVDELRIYSRALGAGEIQQLYNANRPAVSTGPIAYLKLDEGTGVTAADSSGNGNTGTLMNGALWTAGHSGQAVALDGIDDYIRIAHSPALNAFPLTAAVWFKTTTNSGVTGLINKYLAGSFNGYQIFFLNGNLCAWYMMDGANYVYDATTCTLSTAGFNDGSWHQAALVVDTSGGSLYVDGALKATRAWTGTAGPPSTTQDISVGYYGGYLAGTVDEIQIYNRALSAVEVQQLFTGVPPADTTPPSVAITAPAGGATVSGTVTVTANASDNVGVVGVQFKLDGANLGAEDTASPYSVSWNTTTATNGSHTLTAVARDAAGNQTTSTAVTVTVSNDTTPPTVSITAPAGGATVSGTVSVTANASDNVGVVGVQFKLDGANLGAEDTASPYSVSWNTTTAINGSHTLTAVARDAAGNQTTSTGVSVTVSNPNVVTLGPQDTYINLNTTNYSTNPQLSVYTWPANQAANAILMKFDLSAIPPTATVTDATLQLALVASDAAPEATYTVTAAKIVGKNPVISAVTGYTADGVTAWTPNSCCSGGVPLAQADISAPYDTPAIDKTLGFKSWSITGMVQEWLAGPATNFGLLLDADVSKLADRYRSFASMKNTDPTLRPSLRVTYSLVPDVTPPVISVVLATAVTSSGATITWTTNEPSDSQVEYGTTASYGTLTTLDARHLTAHLQSLAGLTAGTIYHYRVRSRDVAGNLATSGDSTFTTLPAVDTTPPSVSITAPSAGATVSGAVTVSANATDNVGVVGVQFKLDGANLGAEDTASPYSVSWNTATAANGSHTLTAVARDAAGNQTTSAPIAVTVSNSAGGIAALYPGDVGIEANPNVVFVERFDEATLTSLFSRWGDILNGAAMSWSSDVPPGSPVAHSLNIPWVGGGVNNGGHLYRQLSPGVDDTLYVRYYIKYPTTGQYHHSGIWMGGYNPPLNYPNPQAGIKPVGNDRFSAAAEQNHVINSFDHYDYWMNMRPDGTGTYWGNFLLNNPAVQANVGQWTCVEHMVKLNNPTTSFNGEHAIWLNGVKVSHLGLGFPNGSWSGGIFTQNPAGTPFEGFQWRSDASLNLNWIWLQNYSPDDPAGFSSTMLFAHVVAAKSYIGCLASGSSDTTPPTVSITAPGAGSTVSGSAVTVTASASDNVGVVGVQFKLDGANLGAEDTAAPYSIVWNTTATANGSHTLTAVARDAAGNTTTSAGVAVTVSNAASAWPNEPAGLTLRTDWGMDQVVPTSGDVPIVGSGGWNVVGNAPVGSSAGWTALVSDPAAPFSPSNVYDFVYPAGMVEGSAPSTVYYAGLGATEVYMGFWWKPSSPFDYGPDGNKIAFLFNGGGGAGGQQFMILLPDGRLHVLPEYPGDFRWRDPNVNATFVTLGAWHRIEWYSNRSSGAMKWWLDGVLQGSYTDVVNSFAFDMFQFSPTWGGNIGARKAETDHYWFDHVHLSAR